MILAYHRVNKWYKSDALTVSPRNFENQMQYMLQNGFKPVHPEDYFSRPFSYNRARTFLVTFDDGYADNLWYAMPVMQKLGIRPLIFLTVRYVGSADIFSRYSDNEKDRFLNWEEIKGMSSSGAVFGSHSLSHPRLTELDEEQLEQEVSESKKAVEHKTGRKTDVFCYPYGDFNRRVVESVKQAGYRGAVVTPGWKKIIERSEYTMPRTGVYGQNGCFAYRAKIWTDFLKERYF